MAASAASAAQRAIRRSFAATDGTRSLAGGLSSAGRAVALQASGHRFDPDRLHQAATQRCAGRPVTNSRDENTRSGFDRLAGSARVFDIVNGFLNRCRGAWQSISDFNRKIGVAVRQRCGTYRCNIWLRFSSIPSLSGKLLCRLVVDGVDSQA